MRGSLKPNNMKICRITHGRGLLLAVVTAIASSLAVFWGTTSTAQSGVQNGEKEEAAIVGPFLKCRKDAVARQGADGTTLKADIEACRDRFPEAAVYMSCKKKAIGSLATGGLESSGKPGKDSATDSAKDAALIRGEIAQCVRKARAASVATDATIPLFKTASGDLTFAGLGLSEPVPIKQLGHPDFNCSHVEQLISGGTKPEFLGFGNHPHLFPAWKALSGKAFEGLLVPVKDPRGKKGKSKKKGKAAPTAEEYRSIRGIGRVYGWPMSNKSAVMFPLGYCYATRRLDDKYREMKMYYLIDRQRQVALPYLGVAFYTPEARVQATRVESLANKILGITLPAQRSPRGGKLIFAGSKIENFDEEGDPLNLCGGTRAVKYLAVAKERLADKGNVDFFLMANVGNLCQYGDSIAERSQSKAPGESQREVSEGRSPKSSQAGSSKKSSAGQK